MSKVSEYMEMKKKLILEVDSMVFSVTDLGDLYMDTAGLDTLVAEDALELANWIIDTFGEPEGKLNSKVTARYTQLPEYPPIGFEGRTGDGKKAVFGGATEETFLWYIQGRLLGYDLMYIRNIGYNDTDDIIAPWEDK